MNTTILLLLAGAVALVAVGVFVWLRSRGPKEEPVLHFRCPGCNRRLRFRARQSGHAGRCSHCNKDLIFPHPSKAID